MQRPDRLDVYYGSELVGTIHDASPVAFEYAASWLDRAERMTVAAIALQPGRNDSAAVQAFFENLLPEGELRHYLAEQRKSSTLFSLLLEVAGDTAGGFVIVPGGGSIPSRPPTRRPPGRPWPPRSTHILKPNIKRLAWAWHSAANETIVMRTAANCGLPTAEVFYEPHTESCVVRRFDRLVRPDGTLARLVQYDLCQLAGTVSERKYEKEGGPGLAACAELIQNLSIYNLPGKGVTLTPFHDLMCTRLYPGMSQDFAFAIGGEYEPAAMTSAHLAPLAQQLGMRPRFLARQAADLARRMPDAMEQAVEDVKPALPHAARTLAERLQRFVQSTTMKLAARLAQ